MDPGNTTLVINGALDLSGVRVCQNNTSLVLPPTTVVDASTAFDANGNDGISVTINGTTFTYTSNGNGATGTLAELNGAIAGGATSLEEAISNLPVSLTSFRAVASDKEVLLSWETATESENEAFLLECSQDGEAYRPLLRVAGRGNSQSVSRYTATDVPQRSGDIYYRLR